MDRSGGAVETACPLTFGGSPANFDVDDSQGAVETDRDMHSSQWQGPFNVDDSRGAVETSTESRLVKKTERLQRGRPPGSC